VIDELRAREASGKRIGVIEEIADPVEKHRLVAGSILLVDDNLMQIKRVRAALGVEHRVAALGDDPGAGAPDLAVVSANAKTFDGFRIIGRMRSAAATRHLPILAIVDADDRARTVRALELGAHDIIARPLDDEELLARARTLMRRKRYMDALRDRLDQSLELAITDQLTGLYNRRFLFAHRHRRTNRRVRPWFRNMTKLPPWIAAVGWSRWHMNPAFDGWFPCARGPQTVRPQKRLGIASPR
jgi:two-component system cell cycle response regulator